MLLDRILATFGLVRITEAAGDYIDINDDPATATLRAGQQGYRQISQPGRRQFSQMSYDEILKVVWEVYQSNPLAKRGIQIKVDHVLGRGVIPQTEDEKLQAILDEFWQKNDMNGLLPQFLLDYFLFGELCLPVFVRETDGMVSLGFLDSLAIEDIVTHPLNVLDKRIVTTKRSLNDTVNCYRIIAEDQPIVTDNSTISARFPELLVTAGQANLEPWELRYLADKGLAEYTGSCFYFSRNNTTNQVRGYSDLLQAINSLEQHANTLFSLAEREDLAGYFSWMVSIIGDKEAVLERAAELNLNPPIARGAINVHNESETWAMETPDLKQQPSIETAKALKINALNTLSQPPHWHGEENTANRATAESSATPSEKALVSDQDQVRKVLTTLCEFVRDQAQIARQWTPSADETGEIDIQMPEITRRNIPQVVTAIRELVQSLSVAQIDLKIVSRETSALALAKGLAEFGIEYDAIAELERIDEQDAEEQMATANRANQFLTGLLADETE